MVSFRSIFETTVDVITKLMSRREDIDSKENALDHHHDLPVYRRLHALLTNLMNQIGQFDSETKLAFRCLPSMLLQFDRTLALLVGTFLIQIAVDRDDLQSMLNLLEENLSKDDFESVVIRLGSILPNTRAHSFLQQLTPNEKLNLAQWFIEEKDQGLFVFELLKKQVFSQKDADREQCQRLLRRLRESENLFLRQQALEYTVQWKQKKEKVQRGVNQPRIKIDPSARETTSDMNLFNIFDDE